MPKFYIFLQLSFAMQNIIQLYSDLGGGSKIEKVVQGAPLSPTFPQKFKEAHVRPLLKKNVSS